MPSVPSSRTQKAHSACLPPRGVQTPSRKPCRHFAAFQTRRPPTAHVQIPALWPSVESPQSRAGCLPRKLRVHPSLHCVLVVIGRKPSVSTVPPRPSRLPQSVCRRNRSPLRLSPRGAGALLCLRRAARARRIACQRRKGRFPLTPLSARAIFAAALPAHAVLLIPTVRSRANRFPANIRQAFRPTAVTAGPSTIRHPRKPLRGKRGRPACPRLPILFGLTVLPRTDGATRMLGPL